MKLLQQRLQQHEDSGLKRELSQPQSIDFCSNDYLGFAQDLELKARFVRRLTDFNAVGSSGSRLLRGNLSIHEETEQLLAMFSGREAALLFSSGYLANLAIMQALLRSGDRVFSDALNHASMIDGIRLTAAQKIIFPHRDYDFLEQKLKENKNFHGLTLIFSESLFSMEGDLADLNHLAALSERYGALLIIDEAHSTGLWGNSLVHTLGLKNQVFATIHPAGKALGASGAWIAGSDLLKRSLINFARSFIFSTAPLPALSLLLQEAIYFYEEVGEKRSAVVRQRAAQVRQCLALPNDKSHDESPIIAVPMGSNQRALTIAHELQKLGWDIRAIRPPTVPENTARLRITVKWQNTETQIKQLLADLKKLGIKNQATY